MSEHAIEAFSDTLSLEMKRFDVQASVIQPGNYKSDIVKSRVARRDDLTDEQKNSPYYEDVYKDDSDRPDDRSNFKNPDEVTAAIKHAMFDPNPKQRYMVVPNS